MAFYIKVSKKDIIMTDEDEQDFRNNIICRFCEKKILNVIKLAIIVILVADTEVQLIVHVILIKHSKKVILLLSYFNIFSNYDCHMFFKKLVDKKMIK